jgi:hypothetical protein
MKDLRKYFKTGNPPHHAYLFEGERDDVLREVLAGLNQSGIKTLGNPDFCHISVDIFKIDDARSLRSFSSERSFTSSRKIFIVSANNFLYEAQNSLLKMFEEPSADDLFILIMPDTSLLAKTFTSRFFIVRKEREDQGSTKEAEKFIRSSPAARIDFLKELLQDENGDSAGTEKSKNSRALDFLSSLESALYLKFIGDKSPISETVVFKRIFNARELLRQPGSSAKNLLESIALSIPDNTK